MYCVMLHGNTNQKWKTSCKIDIQNIIDVFEKKCHEIINGKIRALNK